MSLAIQGKDLIIRRDSVAILEGLRTAETYTGISEGSAPAASHLSINDIDGVRYLLDSDGGNWSGGFWKLGSSETATLPAPSNPAAPTQYVYELTVSDGTEEYVTLYGRAIVVNQLKDNVAGGVIPPAYKLENLYDDDGVLAGNRQVNADGNNFALINLAAFLAQAGATKIEFGNDGYLNLEGIYGQLIQNSDGIGLQTGNKLRLKQDDTAGRTAGDLLTVANPVTGEMGYVGVANAGGAANAGKTPMLQAPDGTLPASMLAYGYKLDSNGHVVNEQQTLTKIDYSDKPTGRGLTGSNNAVFAMPLLLTDPTNCYRLETTLPAPNASARRFGFSAKNGTNSGGAFELRGSIQVNAAGVSSASLSAIVSDASTVPVMPQVFYAIEASVLVLYFTNSNRTVWNVEVDAQSLIVSESPQFWSAGTLVLPAGATEIVAHSHLNNLSVVNTPYCNITTFQPIASDERAKTLYALPGAALDAFVTTLGAMSFGRFNGNLDTVEGSWMLLPTAQQYDTAIRAFRDALYADERWTNTEVDEMFAAMRAIPETTPIAVIAGTLDAAPDDYEGETEVVDRMTVNTDFVLALTSAWANRHLYKLRVGAANYQAADKSTTAKRNEAMDALIATILA